MATYRGLAMIKMGDVQVEVMAHIRAGVEQRSGLGWWRGTFSTLDEAGAFALMTPQDELATIELAGEDDTGRVVITRFMTDMSGRATGAFTGSGASPRW